MGGSCCKISGNFSEIQFSQSNTSRIKYNNNIKLNVTSADGYTINMYIDPKWSIQEIKNKYCSMKGKKDCEKLVFMYKQRLLDEEESLDSLGIGNEITIIALDSNDYNI